MLLRSDWLLSMDLWLDENNDCISELSAFLVCRQCSSRFSLVEIVSESASTLSLSKFWRTAWMMRIFYWRLMKKELWFLMDRKIGYSEWGGLIKDVTDASDWSKRFNFYISGLLPIFSEFSRFSELKKKRHPQKICGWEIFFKHRQFPSKSEWIIVNWSKREIWVQTAGIFSFHIIDFTIGNHQNHQKLYFFA